MARMKKLLKEGVVFGVLVVVVGTIISKIVGRYFSVELPKVCKSWNRYYAMEISLFFTGLLAHFFCEAVGINRWYCKNGAACR